MFALEKQHLRPVSSNIDNMNADANYDSSIARSVRKDNIIWCKSNRHTVPLGTFNKTKQVYIEITDDEYLLIRATKSGPLIAKHKIDSGKGKLIQDRNHTRDRTKGIDSYIQTVASSFSDENRATLFLEEIRKLRPRYIRDQLQMISKQIKLYEQRLIDLALEESVKKQLFSATDFIDMVQYLNRQQGVTVPEESSPINHIKPIHSWSESIIQTEAHKREIQEYVSVLEGEMK